MRINIAAVESGRDLQQYTELNILLTGRDGKGGEGSHEFM
jgi:hypothetical protein